MKVINTIVATIAIVAATATTVQARDSFSTGINIDGHGYIRHSIGTHHHASAFRSYYRAPVVYYSSRPVVYYAPSNRYSHFNSYILYGRHMSRGNYRHSESRRDYSRHGEVHHNRRGNGHRFGRR
ncbi:MAG: hypothetical protein ACI8PW_001940 [Methylophilaceae bacterium]|jgi:hypothetical protein